MESEPLVFIGTCDLAGLVRGKGFAQTELSQRLRELADAGLIEYSKPVGDKPEVYALAARAQSLSSILTELYN